MPGQQPPPGMRLPPGAQVQQVQVPVAVVAQLRVQFLGMVANAIVSGNYDGSEQIPDNYKRLIADMVVTISQNPAYEKARCEHCAMIRLQHTLDLETGNRLCAVKDDPNGQTEESPERTVFKPTQPRIITPG